MKSYGIKLTGYFTLLLGFVFLFAQCESEVSGMEQESVTETVVNMRGAGPGMGDCLASGGAGPVLTKAELCENLALNFSEQDLSEAEKEALRFMREEEKMARDVYLMLYEKWELPIFNNISQSEQRHMDVIGCLLEKYEMADPAKDKEVGAFTNTEVQDLYDQLIASGYKSLEDALLAGATIEDRDIYDLNQALGDEEVDNEDIRFVLGNLTRASGNHLRAFMRQIERVGATYEPVFLSPEAFKAVLDAESNTRGRYWKQNRGNNPNCLGTGPGAGQGPKGKGNRFNN